MVDVRIQLSKVYLSPQRNVLRSRAGPEGSGNPSGSLDPSGLPHPSPDQGCGPGPGAGGEMLYFARKEDAERPRRRYRSRLGCGVCALGRISPEKLFRACGRACGGVASPRVLGPPGWEGVRFCFLAPPRHSAAGLRLGWEMEFMPPSGACRAAFGAPPLPPAPGRGGGADR